MLNESTSAEPSPSDPREQLDRVIAFMRRTLRLWWVVLIALVVGGIACAIFFRVRTPLYRSQTTILYTEGIRPADATGDPRAALRDVGVRLREMLMSRSRLEGVIQEFGLYADIVHDQGIIDAVDEFRKDVEFSAPGSDTYTVGYRGTSPKQAKAVVERLVSSLIEEDVNIRRQQSITTRDFLDKERKRTEEKLKITETELARFMAEHPDFATDIMLLQTGAGSAAGAAIRASRSTEARNSARGGSAPRAYYRVMPRPASTAGGQVASAVDPRAVAQMRDLDGERARAQAALAAAQTDLSEKLTRFTEQHPDVRSAQANLERAQARLSGLTTLRAQSQPVAAASEPPSAPSRVVRRVPVHAHAARGDQTKPAPKAPSDPEQIVRLETDWAQLTRNVTEARQRHDAVEASFFKADLSAHSQHGGKGMEMTILDPAYLPLKPTPPGPLTWIGIFVVLSLVVGGLFAVGGAAVDDRIYSARDVAMLTPLLVEIPREPKGSRKRR